MRSLSGISIKSKCPRVGLRVVFNPREMGMYATPVRFGSIGKVVSRPVWSKRATCIRRGVGAGRVFVKWDHNQGTRSMYAGDLDKVR